MVNRPPLRNLGPAEQWGKWAENEIIGGARDTTQQFQAISRSLDGVNAAIRGLTQQVETLAVLQAQIPIVQSYHRELTGAIPTGVVLSEEIDFPEDKSECNIFASFTANFRQPSSGSGALRRTRLSIGGTLSPWATWYINVSGTTPIVYTSGTFGSTVLNNAEAPNPTVTVAITADSGLSGGLGVNPTAVLDFIAIFS